MPPATIGSLPDELLTRVWGCLELEERHRTVPLVCKHWAQLVSSTPHLLRHVWLELVSHGHSDSTDAQAHSRISRVLRRLWSLHGWPARRAAGQVLLLGLDMVEVHPVPEAYGNELAAAVSAVCTVLGAAGICTDLCLRLPESNNFRLGSWLTQLHSLQCLTVRVQGDLSIDVDLRSLPALVELELSADNELAPRLHLPSTLTMVQLQTTDHGHALLSKMAALPRLHTLNLDVSFATDSYSVLTRLASLRRLELTFTFTHHLSQLTQLQSLRLDGIHESLELEGSTPAELTAALEAALQPLTRLTQLMFYNLGPPIAPPTALSCLTRLQHFAFNSKALAGSKLPAGPWLASLRQLTVPADLAANSVLTWQVLEAGGQLGQLALEQLGIRDIDLHLHLHLQNFAAVWQVLGWAAQHQPLRRLFLRAPYAHCPQDLQALQGVLQPLVQLLESLRPDLTVDTELNEPVRMFRCF